MFQNVLDPRSRPKLNEAAAWCAVGLLGAQIAAFGAALDEPQRPDRQPMQPIARTADLACAEAVSALLSVSD